MRGDGALRAVPIISTNIWTDDQGDIHDRVRAFAVRERLRLDDGANAPGHMIWTRDPEGGSLIDNFLGGSLQLGTIGVLDQWLTALRGDTVMVGRDIGTVVLPDATLKVYLVAAAEVRATRRAAEMGAPERYEEYLAEILRRDAADSGREIAPLRQAEGAIVLDTGVLDVEACVAAIAERLEAIDSA